MIEAWERPVQPSQAFKHVYVVVDDMPDIQAPCFCCCTHTPLWSDCAECLDRSITHETGIHNIWYTSILSKLQYCTSIYHKSKGISPYATNGSEGFLLIGQLLAVCRHHLLRLVPLAACLETCCARLADHKALSTWAAVHSLSTSANLLWIIMIV